jgi:protein-S-isoprenylcysteine O-methyltransferase Ste14
MGGFFKGLTDARIHRATVKVIKASILFLMLFVGLIFMLVGLAQHLNATVPKLANGLGTLLVGAVLIFLALFARLFKN